VPIDDVFIVCIYEPFKERAESLVASGLARKRANGYRITETGDKNARRVQLMRRYFGIEGAGLYAVAKEARNGKRRMK
jgi:hypothetical protein